MQEWMDRNKFWTDNKSVSLHQVKKSDLLVSEEGGQRPDGVAILARIRTEANYLTWGREPESKVLQE